MLLKVQFVIADRYKPLISATIFIASINSHDIAVIDAVSSSKNLLVKFAGK